MLVKEAAKAAVVLVLGFAAAVLAIRMQPYGPDPTLDFILPPDGCSAPCFLGIRPGRTTVAEQMRLLIDSGHVADIDYLVAEPLLTWYWRGLEIRAFPDDNPAYSRIDDFGVVQQTNLTTALSFGDMWLLLREAGLLPQDVRSAAVIGQVVDAERGIVFYRLLACQGHGPYYWQTPAGVWIGRPPYPEQASPYCV